ncbi:MAG: tyrosine-type recombinase/integrase [Rhodothermales bacterium]|nr:tyrosine-type recombinase/integrase [Rhodothermales bacterium]
MPYATRRSREYLTQEEVSDLIKGAGSFGRNRLRDTTLILICYRHGLRVSEAKDLRWEQVDFRHAVLHVRRIKNGSASTHPLGRKECRRLQRLRRLYPEAKHVFMSKLKGPLTRSTIYEIVSRAGRLAGIPFLVHPHMLRHACGYKLANDGQDTRAIQAYLGHRNINHTVRYTELSPERFLGFWKD